MEIIYIIGALYFSYKIVQLAHRTKNKPKT